MNKRYSWTAALAAGLVVLFLIIKDRAPAVSRKAAEEAAKDASANVARDIARQIAAEQVKGKAAEIAAAALAPTDVLLIGTWRDAKGLTNAFRADHTLLDQEHVDLSIPVDEGEFKGTVSLPVDVVLHGKWEIAGPAVRITIGSADDLRIGAVRFDAPALLNSRGPDVVHRFEAEMAKRLAADLPARFAGKQSSITVLQLDRTTLSYRDGNATRTFTRVE